MPQNEDLRRANKRLIDQLKKSQEEISQLIVSAKHSDPRLFSLHGNGKPALTSTLCSRNHRPYLHSTARAMPSVRNSIPKSPGILKRKATPTKAIYSSPRQTKATAKSPSKYRVISKFLQQKSDEGHDLTFSQPPSDQPLLTDPGNSRPLRASQSLPSQPKSILSRSNRDKPAQVTFHTPDNKYHSDHVEGERRTPPLLGYDWIAGVVDNSDVATPKRSESFFEEMKEFRQVNRAECHSRKYWNEIMKTPTTPADVLTPYRKVKTKDKSPDPSDTRDPRIVNFTINKRLFPVPVDPRDELNPGTNASPRYIRVSIPKSSLASPYRYKALHRNTFTEGCDSLSLPDHCVMGWQHTVPKRDEYHKQPSTGLDLRSSMRPKENLVELQLKSGQISMPVKQTAKHMEDSLLDESYALQYKLMKSRNRK